MCSALREMQNMKRAFQRLPNFFVNSETCYRGKCNNLQEIIYNWYQIDLKGALDKYNISLFISNSIEDFKLNQN